MKDKGSICLALVVLALPFHITHSVMLLSGHKELAQSDEGGSARLIEHYMTFVGEEWNSPLITDIYLEKGNNSLAQSSCVDPLF